MGAKVETGGSPGRSAQGSSVDENRKAVVFRELEKILKSNVFRTSQRCKQFLSYVVAHTLEGQSESLKERNLGVELFQRSPAYVTGDDPVVRVAAGEVRRRLHQYYAEEAKWPEVRIEVPVGSYIPEFHWPSTEPHVAKEEAAGLLSRNRYGIFAAAVLVFILGVVLASGSFRSGRMHFPHASSVSTLDQFWAPLFSTPQPVLVCLASPVVYRPSQQLYKRYSQTHPGELQTEVERFNRVLPLLPDETVEWKDIEAYEGLYVVGSDAVAATTLAGIFARINKPSQVRFGGSYSYEDLRDSPAVLIGAFDSHWTLELTSDLPFTFAEENGSVRIVERKPPGRVWSLQSWTDENGPVDYAVVSRLFDSKTGQFLVVAASIGHSGTRAAGELLSHEDYLHEGLRSAPSNWPKQNLQLVLRTNLIDSVPGPPIVVATRCWPVSGN